MDSLYDQLEKAYFDLTGKQYDWDVTGHSIFYAVKIYGDNECVYVEAFEDGWYVMIDFDYHTDDARLLNYTYCEDKNMFPALSKAFIKYVEWRNKQ